MRSLVLSTVAAIMLAVMGAGALVAAPVACP